MKIPEFKLFNTDGKTFFDFRSDPNSRMEAFVITFCDDGTVVMTGDYGVLAWKRNYHQAEDSDLERDYGFPDKRTNINYFAEKICQHGVSQQIKDWNVEQAIIDLEEYFKENDFDIDKVKEVIERVNSLSNNEQRRMYDILHDVFPDEGWEVSFGEDYTEHFKFMFEVLQSVSEQILEVVKRKENVHEDKQS